jgi:hypothetical protein
MENTDLIYKIKCKIDRLLEKGCQIEYLESSRYEQEPIKLDKIKISKVSISSSEQTPFGDYDWVERFEREVSLDFQRNPILNAEDAEEVYQYLLSSVGDLTESYLNN